MDEVSSNAELFELLRQLAIVSAALNHQPLNREELLATRTVLLEAALGMGFAVSLDQQRRLCERLLTNFGPPEVENATRDHEEIFAWATEHDAVPAEVRRPTFDHQPTALRFLSGEAKSGTPELCPISWEDFFARFDLMRLAVVFDYDVGDYEFVADPVRPNKIADA